MKLFGIPKSPFYKRHLKWTSTFVKNNLEIIEKNYSLYPTKNKWECNVHSVSASENENVYKIDYVFLKTEYEKIIKDVTKIYGIKDYWVTDIWYNYYKNGQYQEPHSHLGFNNDGIPGGFTCVHYMIFDPKYHFPTKFVDTTFKPPKIKCGDILFFPDDLMHYVPANRSNKPRLTTAFTISTDMR